MGGNILMVLNFYSKKDPQNLSESLMQVKVASKINLFWIHSRPEPPYKSISFLSLSDNDSKVS